MLDGTKERIQSDHREDDNRAFYIIGNHGNDGSDDQNYDQQILKLGQEYLPGLFGQMFLKGIFTYLF